MATQTNVPDIAVEEEDLMKMTPAEFYASAKHQAVRKLLGASPEPRVLPPWTWKPNDRWQKLRGCMSEFADRDTSDVKDAERAREREHDKRKFGFPSHE